MSRFDEHCCSITVTFVPWLRGKLRFLSHPHSIIMKYGPIPVVLAPSQYHVTLLESTDLPNHPNVPFPVTTPTVDGTRTYLEVHPLSLDSQQHLNYFHDERKHSFPLVHFLFKRLHKPRSFHCRQFDLIVLQRLVYLLRLSEKSVTTVTIKSTHHVTSGSINE